MSDVWVAAIVQGATTLIAIGVAYGRIAGRFDTIERRLDLVEGALGLTPSQIGKTIHVARG